MTDLPMPRGKRIWINAGETSGDIHGAMLMRALKAQAPGLEFVGMGGPAMRAEGLRCVARVEELSVMGFTEVLAKLPGILGLLRRIKAALPEERPFAIILIDAPDFNFRVAKMAAGLDMRVFYYISPKLWAWRQGRVRFLKRFVDRMLLILPFEQEFYNSWHMPATFVGNPLVDETRRPELLAVQPVRGRVGIMPGSRRREIESLMPPFAEAARLLLRLGRASDFHIMRAPSVSEEAILRHWPSDIPLTMHGPENRYQAMRSCSMLLAASGTATLESALLEIPTIVAYRFSSLTFNLAKMLIKVPFISLPNLILGQAIFPELLQGQASGRRIAEKALDWLAHPQELARIRAGLATVAERLGPPGATARAASIILNGTRG